MKRRHCVGLLAGFAIGFLVGVASAQTELKARRIGLLRVGTPPAAFIDNFRQGLRDLGFIEGTHYIIDYGLAQSAAQISEVSAALMARKIELLLASGTPSVLPAKEAAARIPVVFVATLDPVATGLVGSLARPGGNMTGMTSISGDLIAKRLEMIREILPTLTRIAILVREGSPTGAQYLQQSEIAAKTLGLELQTFVERSAKDIDAAIAAAQGSGALVIADDAEFTADRIRIAELALRSKLPTVFGLREMVEAGGLMAYGANFGELYRRAASHVFKILHGANPGDLPIEQPTKFELILNLRTARAIGLAIPQSVLSRADELIE